MAISKDLGRGLVASSSIMLGYFPVAVSFGVAAVGVDIAPWLAVLISVCVYAGASQFILLLLIAEQTPVLSMVLIVIVVNLRHLFYGPALLTQFSTKQAHQPYALMAFGLTDEVFASARAKLDGVQAHNKAHWYLGLQLGAYSAWVLGTVVGAYVANDWLAAKPLLQQSLAFVLPALFFALLLDMADHSNRGMLIWVAFATAIALLVLPAHSSLIVGMVAGSIWALLRMQTARSA